MATKLDLTGQQYGCWTVLSEGEKTKSGARRWLCKCICGTEKLIEQGNLRRGKTKSCGCINKTQDLTGQRFNKLTVIEKDIEKSKFYQTTYWKCQCDCGNIISATTGGLKHETTKSCGCYKNSLASNLGKSKFKDLTGQRFGFLTVKELAGKDKDGRYQYLCECDCGNAKIIRASSLTSGNTKSCGECSHITFGELTIKKILEENNIFYEYQKKFPNCIYPSGKYPTFDFYIDNRYVLEFDGQQHFEITGGWNNMKNFEKTIERDEYKNEWCKNNNIPLIRIPYTKLSNLSFQDIWLPV